MGRVLAILLVASLVLPGCARKLRVDPGPDEFGILPAHALVEPSDYTRLPEPGAAVSTARVSPFAMAYGALGGNSATPPRLLGAGAVESGPRQGGFLGLFGVSSKRDILDASEEAARLSAIGIPVGR